MFQPRVTDISHHNTVRDLRAAAAAGIWGVIHKATQGTRYRDPTYVQRRQAVLDAGMLWGAYHFGDNSDPIAQVSNFLDYAKPAPDTLMCLDYEDHPSGRTMRPQQMVAFLREIERRTGQKAVLYSGNVIKENMLRLSAADQEYVASHLLWLCQYGPQPKLPPRFTQSFLWQYTDGKVGPQPHTLAGITGEVDLNLFNGTREELAALWLGPSVLHSPDKPARGVDDTDTDMSSVNRPARGADDVDVDEPSGLPPFLRASRPATGGLNVQPPRARYDIKIKLVQQELDALGYHEVGDIDGLWGGKTAGAIKAFFNDRGITDRAEMGDVLYNEIAVAKAQGWTRPIAPSRANAKPEDIAPKVEAVKLNLWQRLWAKIAAGAAGLGLVGTGPGSTFETVQNKLYYVQSYLSSVPGWVWFALALAVAGAVWYASERAAKATTKDYNTGRLN